MDQSYFRFLFRLAGKSKQSGLSKSEKRLATGNAAKITIVNLKVPSAGPALHDSR